MDHEHEHSSVNPVNNYPVCACGDRLIRCNCGEWHSAEIPANQAHPAAACPILLATFGQRRATV